MEFCIRSQDTPARRPSLPAGSLLHAPRFIIAESAGARKREDCKMITRRSLLAALLQKPRRLIIDTHLEGWTVDARFPLHHPEGPDLRVSMAAPIENQVEQMREFGLKYTVLVNPRYFGWDNSYSSHSLHRYPNLFVAHGLINPEDPQVSGRLRYWVNEHGFQGMRFSPIYHPKSTWLNSKEHYPLWREAEKLGAVFNYYILPHQMPMLEAMPGPCARVTHVVHPLGHPH